MLRGRLQLLRESSTFWFLLLSFCLSPPLLGIISKLHRR